MDPPSEMQEPWQRLQLIAVSGRSKETSERRLKGDQLD